MSNSQYTGNIFFLLFLKVWQCMDKDMEVGSGFLFAGSGCPPQHRTADLSFSYNAQPGGSGHLY